MQGFLPFLPSDDRGLRDSITEDVLQQITRDLGALLQRDAEGFWDVVLHDASLHVCIDSYLRFKRRSHDAQQDDVHGTSIVEQQLARRVFMVLMRMASGNEHGRGVPQQPQLGQWLYEQRPLDIPKLMDVAALYGPTNPTLTTQLLTQVFNLQPLLLEEAGVIVSPLVDNLGQLQDKVSSAAGRAVRGEPGSGRPLLDCLAYVRDVTVTLGSFIGCYPPAAAVLLAAGHGNLLACLAGVHDRLLPAVLRGVGVPAAMQGTGATCQEAGAQAQTVASALQQLALQLVGLGYLMPPQQAEAAVAGGSGAAGAGDSRTTAGGSGGGAGSSGAGAGSSSSGAGPGPSSSRCDSGPSTSYAGGSGSSSHSKAGGSSSAYGTPCNGAGSSSGGHSGGSSSRGGGGGGSSSRQGGGGGSGADGAAASILGGWDAEQRGTELMNALMNAAHMDGGGGGGAGGAHGNLLHAINRKYGLDVAVACAVQKGDLILDDAQFDYLLALLDSHDRGRVEAAARAAMAPPLAAQGDGTGRAAAAAATSSSGSGTGNAGSSSAACDPAVLASLISQVVEVMGGAYGEGYLHACLHHYRYDAEQVLHHMLEGSMAQELQALDTGLRVWTPPAPAAAAAPIVATTASSSQGGPSWSAAVSDAAALQRREAEAAAARGARVPPASSATSSKTQVHRGVARVLGRLDREAKEATKVLANELQWEYDDEYDDSMDDLIRNGADGVADVEGDDDQPTTRLTGSYNDEPDDAASRPTGSGRGGAVPMGRGRGRGAAGAMGGSASGMGGGARAAGASSASGPGAGAGGRGKPSKHWVLDGRVYNYAKEGAQEVSSREEADKAVQAAKEAALAIHGLGAGGNKGGAGSRWNSIQQAAAPQPPRQQAGPSQPQRQQATTVAAQAIKQPQGASHAPKQTAPVPQAARAPLMAGQAARAQPTAQGSASAPQAYGNLNDGDGEEDPGGERQWGPDKGRGGRVGRGGGRGPANQAHKEQNKAAVGNHHRKDRAMKKMGML